VVRALADFLYPSRVVFYFFLLVFGWLFTAHQSGLYPAILNRADIAKLLLALLSIAALFVSARIVNDLFDLEVDRVSNTHRPLVVGGLTADGAISAKNILLAASLVCAAAVDRSFLFIWACLWAVEHTYSAPPLRIRRFYPLGHLALAAAGGATFLGGASLVSSYQLYNEIRDKEILIYVLLGFLALSHLKDLKDIAGDERAGIFNLPARTGLPRVVAVAAVAAFSALALAALPTLGIASPWAVAGIGVYLVSAVVTVWRTVDVRRLDGLLPGSLAVLGYLGVLWLIRLGQ